MEKQTVSGLFEKASSHLMVGPPASGKTFRLEQILRHRRTLFVGGGDIANVVFCYAAWQDIYDTMQRDNIVTRWVNKMPTQDEFVELVEPYKDRGGSIVVLDDFMGQINQTMVELVTVLARHNNASIFLLFQSLFPANPLARQISLNVKYIHVHKNPRENAQLQFLARQLQPGDFKWIVKAYHDTTKEPYTSFLIDLQQQTPEVMRFRTAYLPSEKPMRAYVKKGGRL